MEASGDGDLNAVAMPGFIDILSSVITVFMFFMLITSAVMFFLSMKIKKEAQEEVRNARKASQAEGEAAKNRMYQEIQGIIDRFRRGEITVDDMSELIESATSKRSDSPDALNGHAHANGDPDGKMKPSGTAKTTSQSSVSAESLANHLDEQALAKFNKSEDGQQFRVDEKTGDMVIIYGVNSISVTEQTANAVRDYIQKLREKNGGDPTKIVIQTTDNPLAPSASLSREMQLGRSLNLRNVLLDKKVSPDKISIYNTPAERVGGGYDWVKIHVEK